jgi:mannitol/fructose-specific phosphotransferase system IIA component
VLSPEAIRLGLTAADKHDAVVQCGQILVEIGAVTSEYVESMCDRESGVALPHGTVAAGRTDPAPARFRVCAPGRPPANR